MPGISKRSMPRSSSPASRVAEAIPKGVQAPCSRAAQRVGMVAVSARNAAEDPLAFSHTSWSHVIQLRTAMAMVLPPPDRTLFVGESIDQAANASELSERPVLLGSRRELVAQAAINDCSGGPRPVASDRASSAGADAGAFALAICTRNPNDKGGALFARAMQMMNCAPTTVFCATRESR
jgi:hypothetical protein